MTFENSCPIAKRLEALRATPPRSAVGPLRLEQYLLGRTTAIGMFEDPFGTVRRRMEIVLEGRMEGETLVLDEHFTFDDGERDFRVWRITPGHDGRYEATADDMVGKAYGTSGPDGVRWSYLFNLALGPRKVRVRFTESFMLVGDNQVLNRANVTLFGIPIGRTTMLFSREAEAAKAADAA